MLQALRNAFRIPELKNKILFTIFIIAVYRLGTHVPVPGIDVAALNKLFTEGGMLGFMDLFSGGALNKFAVFALGIMPAITSSIIMQLLTIVIPKLEEWAKEGETGQKKITQITRYFTLGLALLESVGLTVFFKQQGVLPNLNAFNGTLIVISLTAGTVLIMWLGELITQHGVGNGMSILITCSIIARYPVDIFRSFQVANPVLMIIAGGIIVAVIAAVVFIDRGQRRIPVQYAKRVVGRKVYGGQGTYIPLKVNQAGVIPIIFASSVLVFPATLAQFFPGKTFETIGNFLSPSSPFYLIMYAGLIIAFTYFYTAITFNPIDISDNMKKYGGFIPGVRPGQPTAIYLNRVLSRITLPGSLFLASIAVLPTIFTSTMNIPFLRDFGGTSVLIVVGVTLETMRQLETQLLMRDYEGFLK